ncbi:hypothetical protein LOTGIDRAFT_156740 [Lottia gigantea]|uniref:Uncharacterized protein n=1 Tax=Lottia gigantea TaxID=225164 RepID=V4AFI3_LOTGI|nr:hypothetical protein LOTGIDRAFT_156740 [Lottia gigantea]ESP02794.1 hypothetical protein LOTGIDRAFT_156740 [Lottia gigantea]
MGRHVTEPRHRKIPNQTKPNHPSVAICKVATRLRNISSTPLNVAAAKLPQGLQVLQQITDNLTKPNQTKPNQRLPFDYQSTINTMIRTSLEEGRRKKEGDRVIHATPSRAEFHRHVIRPDQI